MPVLKDFRTTKTIELPNFPESKVEIYDSLLVGEMVGIDYKSDNQIKQVIDALHLFIKSWNFTNEAGETLPITTESLGFLKAEDVQFLGEQIVEFSNEVKKKPQD